MNTHIARSRPLAKTFGPRRLPVLNSLNNFTSRRHCTIRCAPAVPNATGNAMQEQVSGDEGRGLNSSDLVQTKQELASISEDIRNRILEFLSIFESFTPSVSRIVDYLERNRTHLLEIAKAAHAVGFSHLAVLASSALLLPLRAPKGRTAIEQGNPTLPPLSASADFTLLLSPWSAAQDELVLLSAFEFEELVDRIRATQTIPEETIIPALMTARICEGVVLTEFKEEDVQISGVSGGGQSLKYLTLRIPCEQLKQYQLQVLGFQVESHDQGWSSYSADQGTYNNSWTFGTAEFTFTIPSTEGAKQLPSSMKGAQLLPSSTEVTQPSSSSIEVSNNNSADGNFYDSALALVNGSPVHISPLESPAPVPDRLYTNLHASKTWQTHRQTFGPDSALVSSLQMMQDVDVNISIVLHAFYPGWVNHTREAVIGAMLLRKGVKPVNVFELCKS